MLVFLFRSGGAPFIPESPYFTNSTGQRVLLLPEKWSTKPELIYILHISCRPGSADTCTTSASSKEENIILEEGKYHRPIDKDERQT